MQALIIVDLQEASLDEQRLWRLKVVTDNINRVAARLRQKGGLVVHIQHDGTAEEGLEPLSAGWRVSSLIDVADGDHFVRKTLNDAFYETRLEALLVANNVRDIVLSGWATDFCVDASVRSAVSRGYDVHVLADGHTLADRDHLSASQLILHHNWVWANLLSRASVRVEPTEILLQRWRP